jgi:hypothetical protein
VAIEYHRTQEPSAQRWLFSNSHSRRTALRNKVKTSPTSLMGLCYNSKSRPSKTAVSNEAEARKRRVNEMADNLEFCFVLEDDPKLIEGV